MTDHATSHAIPPAQLRRAWRAVTWAGFLGSTYYILCVTGAPRVKFLTELQATAFDFGIIAGLGAFVIALQVLGSLLANRLVRRKTVWMALALTHRLLFIGVIVAPMLFEERRGMIAWIILFLFFHDAVAQVGTPIWFSWMSDLVPQESVNRHWAARQKIITAAIIVVMVLLAFGFHYFEKADMVISGFMILASLGVLLGVIDILLFIMVPEPPNEQMSDDPVFHTLIQPLRDRQFRPFLLFAGFWQFASFLAAPFYMLFYIDFLKLNVLTVQLMATAGSIGVVLTSRLWGLVCDAYGFRPVLQLTALGKLFVPLVFLVTPTSWVVAIPMLTAVTLFDGVISGGIMLASQGVLLKATPKRNRTMYIAATNFFAAGLMAGLAPLIGGRLIDYLNALGSWSFGPYVINGYHGAFALSACLGYGGFVLASQYREAVNVPIPTVLRSMTTPAVMRLPALIHQLQDSEDVNQRVKAAEAIGAIANPMGIAELIRALKDPSHTVREIAADALGRIGVAEATHPLTEALFSPDSGVHPLAARALGRIGGFDSLKALLANLTRQEPHALMETIDSLVQIGDDTAVLPLICLFDRVDSPHLRLHIADALVHLTESESVTEVLALLKNRSPLGQVNVR